MSENAVKELAPALVKELHRLGDEYGPLGVALAAAEFTNKTALLRHLGAPHLGFATTRQLLDELRCRIEVDHVSGGGGLDYSTVDGRPPCAWERSGALPVPSPTEDPKVCPVCFGTGCQPDAEVCPCCSYYAGYYVRCSCAALIEGASHA